MTELFKFAGAILDCYDDPAFIENPRATALFGRELLPADKLDTLPDSCFAVKIAGRTGYKRRFPVYNETITKVSCLYFDNHYTSLPPEIQAAAGHGLYKACEKFGIEKRASIAQHAADAPSTVERVTVRVEEPVIKTAADLAKLAEDRLAWELHRMPIDQRTQAATALFKAAGEDALTRQDVWDYVQKPVTGPLLEGALDDREMLCKNASSEMQHLFAELRNDIEEASADKAVELLTLFDKHAGFDMRYTQGLLDPSKAVYGGWSLPHVRRRNQEWLLDKEAGVVDAHTNLPIDAATAKGLSVEQHLLHLQQRYPKNSESFRKAASVGVTGHMEQKWGSNYVKARKLYFGV